MHADYHGSDGDHCGQGLPFSGSNERTGRGSLEDENRRAEGECAVQLEG